jgi:hypothetical protein
MNEIREFDHAVWYLFSPAKLSCEPTVMICVNLPSVFNCHLIVARFRVRGIPQDSIMQAMHGMQRDLQRGVCKLTPDLLCWAWLVFMSPHDFNSAKAAV